MTRRAGVLLLLVLLAAPLGGCALVPTSIGSGAGAWQSRQAELTQLERWSLQARVASGRLVGWNGNMRWRQEAANFDIRVTGPLGVGGFQARGHLGEVEIRTSRETVVTHDPQEFLRANVGWSFPLERLRYWALGVPDPASPAEVSYDHLGRLTRLEQDGWVLEYTEYGYFHHYELPRRFTLDNGDMHIRVVVDDWAEVG